MRIREVKLNKLLLSLVLTFVVSQLHFNVYSQDILPVLKINTPIKGEIEAGNSKSFQLQLEKDKYVRIASEQIAINSFLKIYDPDGVQILEVRSFVEKGKTNRALFVTDKAGVYRAEIIALGKDEDKGKYSIKLEEIRDAVAQDRFLIDGQRSLLEAEKLNAKRTADAVRQSITKYEEAFGFWQKSGDFLGQGDTASYMGVALYSVGNLPKALEKLQQAQFFYNKAGDLIAEATAFRGIGLVYHVSGKLDEALEMYERGLAINRKLKNFAGITTDLGNIGGVYQYRGEYQKALDYYKNALELNEQYAVTFNKARLLNNIGIVYQLLSENQKALEYLKKALELRRVNGDLRGLGITLNNVALIYTALDDYSNAIENYKESLQVRQKIGDIRGEAVTLNNLGFVQYKMGDYAKASDNLNRSLTLYEKSVNPKSEAATQYILGKVNQAIGKTDEALKFYQRSLVLSREIEDLQKQAMALKSIAEIEAEKNNLDEAKRLMQEALKIVESLRSKVFVQSLRTSFLSSKQDLYRSYVDILMKLHKADSQKGFDKEALEISERSRARSLVDILNESRINISSGVDVKLLNRKRSLQLDINRKENQRTNFIGRKGAEKRLKSVEKQITELLAEYEELNTQIRTNSPQYAELVEPKTLDVEEIQSLLDKNTVLLEYSLGEDQSYAWAVTSDSVKSYQLSKEKDIENAVRNFYDLLTARNNSQKDESPQVFQERISRSDAKISEASINLSKMIIQPFADELKGKRIIIVADGALRYVPFGSLTFADSNKEYKPLVLQNEIINIPSATTLAVLRRRDNQSSAALNSVAVIADPVFSESDSRVAQSIARLNNKSKTQDVKMSITPDESTLGELKRSANDLGVNEFRRLRFSRREAESITSFSSNEANFKAVDFAANRKSLLSEDLSKYQILHFATHGLLNNKNPELSGIVLSLVDNNGRSTDGFLRLHEIYNMKIGADLVVLSACQTALGKDVKGEGLIGLTRGFMYAGANSIVASLWQVEDRATAELMKRFYRAMLKDGQKPSAALRTAKIEMSKDKRWSNPYYWAAFTLQGEWK